MRSASIEFNRIRPHRGSQSGGFEELVTQLAWLEPKRDGDIFHRKGPGADAGVECFVRHRNGRETGWQAKYFSSVGSPQISQLDESIGQALEKHPKLKTYIVALPIDLRDSRVGRQKSELERWTDWVAKWRSGRKLRIELWGAFQLLERLGRDDPQYAGRARFWFDDAQLSPDWFRQRFEAAKAGLGDRYTPELNIELPIRQALLTFCRDSSFASTFERWRNELDERGYRAMREIEKVFGKAIKKNQYAKLDAALRALGKILSVMRTEPSEAVDIEELKLVAGGAAKAASEMSRSVWSALPARDGGTRDQRYAIHVVQLLSESLHQMHEEIVSAERWQVINSHKLLIHGDAGVGKSHLLADAAEYQIERRRPALLVLSGTLVEGDLWSQIINAAGLQGLQTDEFLGALDAAAQAAGTRAVIFVDAINERHGLQIWPSRLAALLKTIEPFPNLSVAVSCRSTYLPFIVPGGARIDGLVQLAHHGFAGHPEASRYYLDKRGIVRMAAPNLVPEFDNPLFLKTCCDFLVREGHKELPRGLRGVTTIFGFYSDAVSRSIEQRMSLDPHQRIVHKALAALAAAFDEGERGYAGKDEALRALESVHASQGQLERSLLSQLESEGVVAIEPVEDDDGRVQEIVRFTFERYSDHRIASRLLDLHLISENPAASFSAGNPLHDYVTAKNAYERAGVIEAIAIQLPERSGVELPDVLDSGPNRWLIQESFRESVLWREQRCFTKNTLELYQKFAPIPRDHEVNELLVAIATEPDNPFNADFLDSRLRALTMPERDEKWSTFVARRGDEDESHIRTLLTWTLQNGMEDMDERRAELAAIALCWLFTTSHRWLRDHATKALATLLARRLPLAARLVPRFATVNDPYVLERLLAASYGASLQGLQLEALGKLAESVLRCILAVEEPVPHLLVRDYARGIVELAKARRQLPKGIDIKRARPPYRSDWSMESIPAELMESYKVDYGKGQKFYDDIVSSTINDGDFARYVIDHAVDDWSDLPIDLVGQDRASIYDAWRDSFLVQHPRRQARVESLERAGDKLRAVGKKRSPKALIIERIILRSSDRPTKTRPRTSSDPDLAAAERAFDSAERALLGLMTDDERQHYESRARAHVHRDMSWRVRSYSWPSRLDREQMRRWVCRRAHELGWTSERFTEFDRHLGSYDRMEHRVERIGKKYQWLALHELLARLSDNLAFAGDYGDRGLTTYQGPWQIGRRDMDPSLLAIATHEDGWRQWDWTWWMPVSVSEGDGTPGPAGLAGSASGYRKQ